MADNDTPKIPAISDDLLKKIEGRKQQCCGTCWHGKELTPQPGMPPNIVAQMKQMRECRHSPPTANIMMVKVPPSGRLAPQQVVSWPDVHVDDPGCSQYKPIDDGV